MIIVGTSLVFVYVVGAVLLYAFQENFIFLDDELPQDYAFEFEYDFEEINLKVEDGANLNAIHFKADTAKGLVLYFHGNQGNLTRWGGVAAEFTRLGYVVLVMDYRGYGKSTGQRSMKALLSDAEKFYQYVLEHFPEDQITLYGRSLGTGLASWLAGKHLPKRLILETPYYSLAAMAKRYYPIYPAQLALRYNFESHEYLKKAQCPVYIFHGTEDEVVPYSQGKKLYESLSKDQGHLMTIDQGMHKNLASFPEFHTRVKEILNQSGD